MKIYSFGIFDTTVSLKTATADGLFSIIGHLLSTEYSSFFNRKNNIEDFFTIRSAYGQSYSSNPELNRDKLETVYHEIGNNYGLDNTLIQKLASIEKEFVLKYSHPVRENTERIIDLIKRRERVVFLSDSLYERSIIEQILKKAGIQKNTYGLYLASETGKTCLSGELYEHMLRAENTAPGEVEHTGTDQLSDHSVPQQHGIKTKLYNGFAIKRYEQIYLDVANPYQQLYAGSSRICRMNGTDAHKSFYDVGASLGGPVLYGFVEDTLEKAIKDGFNKLYFLARDGQIMLRIAEIINEKRNLGLDLKYLYAARQTSHFSAIFSLSERDISLATRNLAHITKGMIAERLNLSYTELASHLESDSIPGSQHDWLTEEDLERVRTCLRSNQVLRARIIEIAAGKRASMLRYLEQEGIFDFDQVAIVDIGWTGGMQDSMYRVIASRKPEIKLCGYYYGIFEYSPDTSESNIKRSYAIMPGQISDSSFVNGLELLTKAQHGTTYDYRESDSGVMEPCTRAHSRDPKVDAIQNGILDFSRAFEDIQTDYPELRGGHISFTTKLLSLLCKPDYETASVLGGMLHSSDQNDANPCEIAPALSIPGALYYSLLASTDRKNEITSWKEATLARSEKLPRMIVTHLEDFLPLKILRRQVGFIRSIGGAVHKKFYSKWR